MTPCRHRAVVPPPPASRRALALGLVAVALTAAPAAPALASTAVGAPSATVPDAALRRDIQSRVLQAARAQPGLPKDARVVVELGQLDPRLRLAPCERVEHRLTGRPWGATRVALRCVQGSTRWQVHLPVTVQVHAAGWVARADLPAGTVLAADHLRQGEVDLAAGALPADGAPAGGRTLARGLAAGEPVRAADLQARRWFAAGDTVQLVAVGRGYRVSGQGQALSAGVEGQRVRVRTDGGRVVTGLPVGEGRVEVSL